MKTVNLNEFEIEFVKKAISDQIAVINRILRFDNFISYDFAENEYRRNLEGLLELEKKLSEF
jgi:hypothetical protein